MANVYRNGNGWRVQKYINGKCCSFGCFVNKQIAEDIATAMEEVDWDKNQYWIIRAEVLGV